MPFNAKLIGRRYGEVGLVVTREGVTRFSESITEHGPVYLDPDAARAEGFPEQVAPPTIMARVQIESVREITADPDIGVGFDGIVHSEQVYEWARPVFVGDVLRTEPLIHDIRTKGSISFLDIVLEVLDASGEQVVWSKSTLVAMTGDRR